MPINLYPQRHRLFIMPSPSSELSRIKHLMWDSFSFSCSPTHLRWDSKSPILKLSHTFDVTLTKSHSHVPSHVWCDSHKIPFSCSLASLMQFSVPFSCSLTCLMWLWQNPILMFPHMFDVTLTKSHSHVPSHVWCDSHKIVFSCSLASSSEHKEWKYLYNDLF